MGSRRFPEMKLLARRDSCHIVQTYPISRVTQWQCHIFDRSPAGGSAVAKR